MPTMITPSMPPTTCAARLTSGSSPPCEWPSPVDSLASSTASAARMGISVTRTCTSADATPATRPAPTPRSARNLYVRGCSDMCVIRRSVARDAERVPAVVEELVQQLRARTERESVLLQDQVRDDQAEQGGGEGPLGHADGGQ